MHDLEELMATTTHRYHSDFARHYYDSGEAEGQIKGKIEGKIEGEIRLLLAVFEGRGLKVSDEARAVIVACDDPALLEAWGRRASTIGSVEELFD